MSIHFRMPSQMSIMGRSSNITNSFINSIIPVNNPSDSEVLEALCILKIDPNRQTCAYCGDPATEWDHLRPLVEHQRPTGYISEIENLVPACGKCNQSKGNKPWRIWITSDAPLSPKSRGIPNLLGKIKRLDAFEKWHNVEPVDFENMVESTLWAKHWQNLQLVFEQMKASQIIASQIKTAIEEHRSA